MEWKERRGPSRQARPRQSLYPLMGMEEPRYVSNAYELYRYGEPGILTRFILPPSDVINERRAKKGGKTLGKTSYELLRLGWTIGDLLIALLVGALCGLFFCATAYGSWIDELGW